MHVSCVVYHKVSFVEFKCLFQWSVGELGTGRMGRAVGHSLYKTCGNTGFSLLTHILPYKDRIVDSVLIKENTGQ